MSKIEEQRKRFRQRREYLNRPENVLYRYLIEQRILAHDLLCSQIWEYTTDANREYDHAKVDLRHDLIKYARQHKRLKFGLSLIREEE